MTAITANKQTERPCKSYWGAVLHFRFSTKCQAPIEEPPHPISLGHSVHINLLSPGNGFIWLQCSRPSHAHISLITLLRATGLRGDVRNRETTVTGVRRDTESAIMRRPEGMERMTFDLQSTSISLLVKWKFDICRIRICTVLYTGGPSLSLF